MVELFLKKYFIVKIVLLLNGQGSKFFNKTSFQSNFWKKSLHFGQVRSQIEINN